MSRLEHSVYGAVHMVRHYTDDQIAEFRSFYEEHGAVKLSGLLEGEGVDELLRAIDDVAAHADEPIPPGSDFSVGRGDGRMTLRYLWRKIPYVRDFVLRRELADPIARIVQSHELRFWFDLTFMHDATEDGQVGDGSAWHHDISAFGFKGQQLPSLWMALTPCDENRSRLRFIDGSHETVPGFYRTYDRPQPPAGEEDGFIDPPDFDALLASGEAKELTWDCEPGDAIIIHPYTIHGAKGNKGAAGQGRRVAMTTRWLGDDIRFLPPDYRTAMKSPGFVKSNLLLGSRPRGEYFPLVWSDAPMSKVA
jgi:ectoine hydroxylase-related dioxygenase (phytanoyl-CoA dioxygenase family)